MAEALGNHTDSFYGANETRIPVKQNIKHAQTLQSNGKRKRTWQVPLEDVCFAK